VYLHFMNDVAYLAFHRVLLEPNGQMIVWCEDRD
jgi:hypothetical protein